MKTGQKNCPVFLVGITSVASAVFVRFHRNFVAGGKNAEKTSIGKSK